MTLQQALEFSRTLAKHNPFVRMQPQEQELANQAGLLLSRMANTEELEDLMKKQEWIARRSLWRAYLRCFKEWLWKI